MINASELAKQRELVFAAEPPDQVEKAYVLLNGLPNCKVQHSDKPYTLLVSYSLLDYTLEGLERALGEEGFQLDHSLLHRIARQMIYYTEDTECHNMDIPDHPTKKQEKEVYIKAYDQHLHGDHDDTPPESRKYK
jgi:hypothetical protein